jgi:hypothetical protein
VSSLASEPVTLAKHHSQAGYLGMAWFRRLNRPGELHIPSEAFTMAVALHLSLPVAAFEGCTCGCGAVLTAASGPLHIVSCNQFAKLPRSETFQHAFDSIIYDVCKGARIEGAKAANGAQTRCRPYATVPVGVDAAGQAALDGNGLPRMRDIIPDRVVRSMEDDQLGPSGRYIVDTAIPSPEAAHHVGAASTTPGAAAAKTYARKYQIYTPVLQGNDRLLAVVCESWGGLHEGVRDRLRKWAARLDNAAPESDRVDRESLSPQISEIWRGRLSCALLLGRVNLVFSAFDKLAGVPARSGTLAYRISHPFTRAEELGRLRR